MDRTSPCERGRYYRDDNVFERRHHHLENCRRFRKEFYWIRSGDFWTPQTCAACRRQIVRTLKRTLLFLWGRKNGTRTQNPSQVSALPFRNLDYSFLFVSRGLFEEGEQLHRRETCFSRLMFSPGSVCTERRVRRTAFTTEPIRMSPCCNAVCSCLFHHCMKCGAANCTDLCHPFVLGFFFFKSVQTFNSLEHTFSATEQ